MHALPTDQKGRMTENRSFDTRMNSTRVSIWVLLGLATLTWSGIWAIGRTLGHLILD